MFAIGFRSKCALHAVRRIPTSNYLSVSNTRSLFLFSFTAPQHLPVYTKYISVFSATNPSISYFHSSAHVSDISSKSTKGSKIKAQLKNLEITAPEILVISDAGLSLGIMTVAKAMTQMDVLTQDLILINSKKEPPVCKIVSKHPPKPTPSHESKSVTASKDSSLDATNDTRANALNQPTKKAKPTKKRSGIVEKELEINSTIDQHDFQIKMNKGRELLGKGYRLKLTVTERGNRESTNIVQSILERLAEDGKLKNAPIASKKKIIFILDSKKQ
ncbi:hypothetical protein O5D80_003502 [Batrachochytrium dendrobatidis]|nr:hypothetical protein O5D80_003502 [Batrachochytrium dendrobatidis]